MLFFKPSWVLLTKVRFDEVPEPLFTLLYDICLLPELLLAPEDPLLIPEDPLLIPEELPLELGEYDLLDGDERL